MATTCTGDGRLKHPSWHWKIKTVYFVGRPRKIYKSRNMNMMINPYCKRRDKGKAS